MKIKNEISPSEVTQLALWLYERDIAHPGNKKLNDFIPKAVELLAQATRELVREFGGPR